MYRQIVQSGSQWAVVTIDEHAVQCTVADSNGGRYYITGYGDTSITAAAKWAVAHGASFASRDAAVSHLADGGWAVDVHGRVEACPRCVVPLNDVPEMPPGQVDTGPLCSRPAATTRVVHDLEMPLCAEHAAELDAERGEASAG